ncbi:MAG TPA: hypothetical protein VMM12_12205 [Longimicrobiales bacterium]|nr:hypothetical protein [Longimicrobiales bacterium]
MAATLDPETRSTLEASVVELDGILHAAVDFRTGELWVVRDPAYEVGPVELAVRARIASLGHDPAQIAVRLTLPAASGPRRRVRFVSAERRDEQGRVTVVVTLEWNDRHYSASATGEKGPAIELKTTAQAALDALQKLSPQALECRIIGIKPIHAFDSVLMVASLFRGNGAPQRLVGAVVVSGDPNAAAAMAVLNALNRTLGNFLHSSD